MVWRQSSEQLYSLTMIYNAWKRPTRNIKYIIDPQYAYGIILHLLVHFYIGKILWKQFHPKLMNYMQNISIELIPKHLDIGR